MSRQKDQNYSRYLIVRALDDNNLKHAKEIFLFYTRRDVLTNRSFEDDIWEINNEKSHRTLCFDFSDEGYRRKAEAWIGCSPEIYRECAKTYVALRLGTLEMDSLHGIASAFCRMAESSAEEADTVHQQCGYAAEFLEMLPGAGAARDTVIERLQEMYHEQNAKKSRQRLLLDFNSYFRFHDEINSFWDRAEEGEKLYYFPVFFWWNLTAVLPLRVTEFLMTPADCLKRKNGVPYIVVRRTRLKGGFSPVTYKIDGDYEKYSYPVSEKIAAAVEWYLERTADMEPSPIDSVFCRQAGSRHRGDQYHICEGPFCYRDLNNALKMFYREVLTDRKIGRINLGDTRHIAMMNLIISGGSPSMCMELAGHEDVNISSHYYANMSNLVECATYELFRRKEKGDAVYLKGAPAYPLDQVGTCVKIKGGWCSSEKVKKRDAGDCTKAMSDAGEIGDCASCRYFRPEMPGMVPDFYNSKKGKQKVDADSWFLMQMIESVRKGIGCEDDIARAILRLQHSCGHYRTCILKGMESEEKHGKT